MLHTLQQAPGEGTKRTKVVNSIGCALKIKQEGKRKREGRPVGRPRRVPCECRIAEASTGSLVVGPERSQQLELPLDPNGDAIMLEVTDNPSCRITHSVSMVAHQGTSAVFSHGSTTGVVPHMMSHVFP